MHKLTPTLLLQEERSGLTELQYYGYLVHCDKNKKVTTLGTTKNYPFFHRSCAKPLQASIIADFQTAKHFDLAPEEIAVCCASHTGEPVHLEVLKGIMSKAGIKESDLQCPVIPPLNPEEQRKFTTYSPLHNNCSGKHVLMLCVCAQNNWELSSYLQKEHPLQKKIYEKIKTLCERKDEMPFTLDGCTAPNWATSLEELAVGFWNLFNTPEYAVIQNAYQSDPLLLGGQNRLDTQLMQMNPKLSAKVGAGGLCYIANTETNEVLGFKIIDADMHARSIVVIETLIKIGWLKINSIDDELLCNSLNKIVKTETGENVGEYVVSDDLDKFIRRFCKFHQCSCR